MGHIHETNTRQSCGVIVPFYALQLGKIEREVNILIYHIGQGLDELVEKLAYLRGAYATQWFTRSHLTQVGGAGWMAWGECTYDLVCTPYHSLRV
jgi:hypothetical protein